MKLIIFIMVPFKKLFLMEIIINFEKNIHFLNAILRFF